MPGKKALNFEHGKYFVDRTIKVKLYDAGWNIKLKHNKAEREKLVRYGYDPLAHYLKLEIHCLRPDIYFKKRVLSLDEMLSEQFQESCRQDLFNNYALIKKTSQVKLTNKKQLSSATILLLVLKECETFFPFKAEELIKMRLKAIPEGILSREDKKARARQIRGIFKKAGSPL